MRNILLASLLVALPAATSAACVASSAGERPHLVPEGLEPLGAQRVVLAGPHNHGSLPVAGAPPPRATSTVPSATAPSAMTTAARPNRERI